MNHTIKVIEVLNNVLTSQFYKSSIEQSFIIKHSKGKKIVFNKSMKNIYSFYT